MSMPNMKELMEKAKEMQQHMQKAQSEISAIVVIGEAGGGLVKIHMNGLHQATRTQISPTLMGEEEDMIEDLVTAAINDASAKIEKATKQKMMSIAKDMNLPEDIAGEGGTDV